MSLETKFDGQCDEFSTSRSRRVGVVDHHTLASKKRCTRLTHHLGTIHRITVDMSEAREIFLSVNGFSRTGLSNQYHQMRFGRTYTRARRWIRTDLGLDGEMDGGTCSLIIQEQLFGSEKLKLAIEREQEITGRKVLTRMRGRRASSRIATEEACLGLQLVAEALQPVTQKEGHARGRFSERIGSNRNKAEDRYVGRLSELVQALDHIANGETTFGNTQLIGKDDVSHTQRVILLQLEIDIGRERSPV
mmetsp:Transcript_18302/g.46512  ORF Transcript_18302/g.46512 Transcript_18302/m.46512 type:complete len:248 (+) Transcript_18302:1081-1824(+)